MLLGPGAAVIRYAAQFLDSCVATILEPLLRRADRSRGRHAVRTFIAAFRRAAKSELVAEAFALFGLQHNWLQEMSTAAAITIISAGISPMWRQSMQA